MYSAAKLVHLDLEILKAEPVNYHNRIRKNFEEAVGKTELSIKIPQDLVIENSQQQLTQDEVSEMPQSDEPPKSFADLHIVIEYQIRGSKNGFQFLNQFSKDSPEHLSVRQFAQLFFSNFDPFYSISKFFIPLSGL